jgi:hypothetical protein
LPLCFTSFATESLIATRLPSDQLLSLLIVRQTVLGWPEQLSRPDVIILGQFFRSLLFEYSNHRLSTQNVLLQTRLIQFFLLEFVQWNDWSDEKLKINYVDE